MNTKTMEGLIGAGANIDLVNTPMRVYKEARRKGDLGTMERAMGYAGEFAVKAEEYRAQADEGTQEETRENREKMELEREEAIRRRREEREKLEKEIDRATKAEQALSSRLDQEKLDRETGDSNLDTKIETETTRAKNREDELERKINSLDGNAGGLSGELDKDREEREKKDKELEDKIGKIVHSSFSVSNNTLFITSGKL